MGYIFFNPKISPDGIFENRVRNTPYSEKETTYERNPDMSTAPAVDSIQHMLYVMEGAKLGHRINNLMTTVGWKDIDEAPCGIALMNPILDKVLPLDFYDELDANLKQGLAETAVQLGYQLVEVETM